MTGKSLFDVKYKAPAFLEAKIEQTYWIKEINHSSFLTTDFLQKAPCRTILDEYMQEVSHSIVTFVTTLLKRVIKMNISY